MVARETAPEREDGDGGSLARSGKQAAAREKLAELERREVTPGSRRR